MLATVVFTVLLGCATQSASAEFGFAPGGFQARTVTDDGSAETRAGVHPYGLKTAFVVKADPVQQLVSGNIKDLRLDLPPGVFGNPEATTKCTRENLTLLAAMGFGTHCPADSQIGIAKLWYAYNDSPVPNDTTAVYNLEPAPGKTAQIGFPAATVPITIDATADTAGDFSIIAGARKSPQTLTLHRAEVVLWGVPNSPAHDDERACGGFGKFPWDPACPVDAAPLPFLTNPGACTNEPLMASITADSWQEPGVFASAFSSSDPIVGCDALRFEPEFGVTTDTSRPDSPVSLGVNLGFEQRDDPATGMAPSPMRRAKVTLPEGMTINPSSADGLGACTDAQLGLRTNDPIGCPDASKLGTVVAETPILTSPLTGSVYLRSQNSGDPGSGEMFRLVMVLENLERGLLVKLPGQVRVNPATGRVETIFDDNPQLPVSRVSVQLKAGPRAALSTPRDCGTHFVDGELTSWSGQVVTFTDSFTVDCPAGGFAPSFEAGSVSPVGGAFSPFGVRVDRPAGDQFLSGVEVAMPNGLSAKLRGVPLCGSFEADNGGCPAGSRIGTAIVGAGSGPNPFFVRGDVYLTDGYRGGPYGLAAHVQAKAGPFDLGSVRVRQALYVDPRTAEIRAVSDPLPQIVKGVPVRLRSVDVDVDRPGFTINPTSCGEKQVQAKLTSIDGTSVDRSRRFQVGDCSSLGFTPKLALGMSGKSQRRTGGHPALRARLTQPKSQANIRAVKVTLPKSIALDPANANGLCKHDVGERVAGGPVGCPASSVIGAATAHTPILNRPLKGKVYFVERKIRNKQGNLISKLPSLLIALRGEVDIDLRANSAVVNGRLATSFPAIPDAPVSKFELRLKGGDGGILAVTRSAKRRFDICTGRHTATVATNGHNGKQVNYPARMTSPCETTASKAKRAAKRKASR